MEKPSKAQQALDGALEDLALALDTLENAGAVEDINGHIAVTWVEYPNGRVGLDACGNLTRVELDDLRWAVEA